MGGRNGADRRHVGADREHPCRQEGRPGSDRGGQPPLRRGGARAVPHGIAVARPSGALRKVEQRLQAVPPPGAFRGFRTRFRHFVGRVRSRAHVRRRHGRPGAPEASMSGIKPGSGFFPTFSGFSRFPCPAVPDLSTAFPTGGAVRARRKHPPGRPRPDGG